MSNISIENNKFGNQRSVFLVAEMSANHNRDFDQAVRILHAAKECGADGVKLQTYTANTLTIDCDNEYFRIGKGTIWDGRTLHDVHSEAYTPWEWQPRLREIADRIGLSLFSTAFDPSACSFGLKDQMCKE